MKHFGQLFLPALAAAFLTACAGSQPMLSVEETGRKIAAGTIFDTRSGSAIPFETLIRDLASVQVVYVGERHTDAEHHRIQLKIIEALDRADRPLAIGMEMFDVTYQPVLSMWTAGELTETEFIARTHWYANWRYDFDLYRPILEAARQRRIPVFALNIPFHIPAKIATGGIDSLLWPDRQFVPDEVDLTDARHRAYLEKIYALHRRPERNRFDFFYEAQCVWEDAMAEAVATHLADRRMVVIAGNGHIVGKFGIPNRAFRRTGAPFATVMPLPAGETVRLDDADYIWVTGP
jgi:uncharacterized iron-regulated protein